jgi:CBS domain-containing protein
VRVQDIMTINPVYAWPYTPLRRIAQMMVDNDCGGIPICDPQNNRLVGFVTDRDIVCRILAQESNPVDKGAQDAMTTNLHTIRPDASVEDCVQMMERYHVRRIPVLDDNNRLVGIVAQADLAREAEKHTELKEEVEEALEQISEARVAM